MAYNLIECNREQMYLMPVSLRDWLPEGHLAWFMLEAVEEIDLSRFYLKYRADGWGRAAYDPQMMVSALLYAYCLGVRSSRQIERACEMDVAFRVITGNLKPDYSTICRFRSENEGELGRLFSEVLRLCAEAGLVKVGTVALDGTKMKASSALSANRTQEHIEEEVRKMLAEARERDEEEEIAKKYDGVEDAYAFEAGRELRVIINPGKLDDSQTTLVAQKIREEVSKTLAVPGEVKVTAIREFRAVSSESTP